MLHDLSSEQEVDLLPRPALVSLGQPWPGVVALWVLGVPRQAGRQAGKKAISTRVNQQDMPQEDRPSGRLASPRPAGWATWSLLLINSGQRLRCRPALLAS